MLYPTAVVALFWLGISVHAAQAITVATFNLENYLIAPGHSRPAKAEAARAKVRESLRAMGADVVGLQEIGGAAALEELRTSLRSEGLDYPHYEHVTGWDTNIQVAVFSRFPIIARRSHTNEGFLLNGRRFRLTRGIVELDIRAGSQYSFTLMVAHLKSRRPTAEADEGELREQEAIVLREKIDARLRASPDINLVVLGDFNDVKDSPSTRAIIGKGKAALVDTRPAERNGDSIAAPSLRTSVRNVTWTHFYARQDTYSRIDYILLSRAMAREWIPAQSYVLNLPNWGLASDHRPVVVTFAGEDK